ncbi:MAG: DNA/RNA non-specific endonuclease [Brumimicrobium sp.]
MFFNKRCFFISVLSLVLTSCASNLLLHDSVTSKKFDETKEIILEHDCITIGYNYECKQARWVAYTLKKSDLEGKSQRKNNFKEDPKLNTEFSATDDDYYKSGYDRGHLAPAADMVSSQNCMNQSFYYSNISPQEPSCNRGVWKRLESEVRKWAIQYDSILVVTGAVLESDKNKRLGQSDICVPDAFYKALLVYHNDKTYTIGFVISNHSSKAELSSFAVTIDELELIINLDFFPFLGKKEQSEIENIVQAEIWK